MSPEAGADMAAVKGLLLEIERNIQTAWEYLGRAQEAADGEETMGRIRDERQSLNIFLNRLAKAQTITDETLFDKDIEELKSRVSFLKKVSDQVKQINPAAPSEAVGYMETAVTLIARAVAVIAMVP